MAATRQQNNSNYNNHNNYNNNYNNNSQQNCSTTQQAWDRHHKRYVRSLHEPPDGLQLF